MTLLYQKIKIPDFDVKQQELIELAKNIAEQQEHFMKKGDYSKKK